MTDYETVKNLSERKSSSFATSLITFYVPNNIQFAISKLKDEMSTAQNIKSKTTKKDVIHALKCGIYSLKNYKGSMDNGIVLCSGITDNKYCL